jgi:hypothetical protein
LKSNFKVEMQLPTRLVSLGLAIGLGAAAAGCGMGPPPVTPADAMRANVQLADLEQGRSLLISKCGGCHRTPVPAEHVAADWPKQLDDMAVRANLKPVQQQLIGQYLAAMAAPARSAQR